MAKSARKSMKRFPGTLDLANHLEIEFSRPRRGSMPYLERGTLCSHPFLGLRAQPARLCPGLLSDRAARSPGAGERRETPTCASSSSSASRPCVRRGAEPARREAAGAPRAAGPRRPRTATGAPPLRALRLHSPSPSLPVGFHVGEGGVVCGPCGERDRGAASHPSRDPARPRAGGCASIIGRLDRLYGGINGFWDYGPLGVELKNNLKALWWQRWCASATTWWGSTARSSPIRAPGRPRATSSTSATPWWTAAPARSASAPISSTTPGPALPRGTAPSTTSPSRATST